MTVTGLLFTKIVTGIELKHLTFYACYSKCIKTVLSFIIGRVWNSYPRISICVERNTRQRRNPISLIVITVIGA